MSSLDLLKQLLLDWLGEFGGSVDCGHDELGDEKGGRDCAVCGGHLESEDEPDLDPGHVAGCVQLRTCILLSGKPQRQRGGG